MLTRICRQCGRVLPENTPANQRYCDPLCRNRFNNSKTASSPVRDEEHGTRTGYARGCRCEQCRAHNAEYSKEYRARQPKGPKKVRSDKGVKRSFLKFEDHGTTRGYGFLGCRCPDCTRAVSSYNRSWRESNRDKYRAAMRSSYRKNPQRHAEYSAERMAAQFDPAALLYCEILERDPCSYHVGPGGTIDHVVAIKTGGDSSWDNLTSACHACNAAKGKKSLLAFMLYRLEVQAS